MRVSPTLSRIELARKCAAVGVGDSPERRTATIGGEAVVKPESRVLLTHRGLRFYGRFAANRG
jgi:hypothetical protein